MRYLSLLYESSPQLDIVNVLNSFRIGLFQIYLGFSLFNASVANNNLYYYLSSRMPDSFSLVLREAESIFFLLPTRQVSMESYCELLVSTCDFKTLH